MAYADFVTAMMALFIVLWLLNTNKPVREAVAGYFKDPTGKGEKKGTSVEGTGTTPAAVKDDMGKLKADLLKSLEQMPDFGKLKNQIEMTVTPEGLRIELLETASGTFFNSGSSKPNDQGRELLILLGQQLGKLPNKISIEGHTDSKPYVRTGDYGNWELSSDRANAARRLMQQKGLGAEQVTQVRGYADQMLRKPEAPLDPSNRRISVIVQHLDSGGEEQEKPAEGAGEKPAAASAAVDTAPSQGSPAKPSPGKSVSAPPSEPQKPTPTANKP